MREHNRKHIYNDDDENQTREHNFSGKRFSHVYREHLVEEYKLLLVETYYKSDLW